MKEIRLAFQGFMVDGTINASIVDGNLVIPTEDGVAYVTWEDVEKVFPQANDCILVKKEQIVEWKEAIAIIFNDYAKVTKGRHHLPAGCAWAQMQLMLVDDGYCGIYDGTLPGTDQ